MNIARENFETDPPLLELVNVTKTFGMLTAVDDVSLSIPSGARHALIGPNGAGKTTLFSLVTGQILPSSGSIRFDGNDITRLPAHRRARLGMSMTFQHSNLLDDLSLRENVALATLRGSGSERKWFSAFQKEKAIFERVDELIADLGLSLHAKSLVGSLSHGERRGVEVALAYATRPKLLLLDEPLAGMSPGEIEEFLRILDLMSDLTFVMIEHNIEVVLRVASSITVLDAGAVIGEGEPHEVAASDAVRRAYLGSSLDEGLFI